MISDEMAIVLPMPRQAVVSSAAEREAFVAPPPHGKIALEGVLCCGRPLPRRRHDIMRIALPPLADLVRQVTNWSNAPGTAEEYLGDYRFLVLDFTIAGGIKAFVQIWSEPFCDLIVEVGPGDRDDEVLQAFADGVRAALEDRGFEIGGNADNFRKTLPPAADADSPRVARELLPILMDVLGYDGGTDLAYKFRQGSHLRPGHVVTGLSRAALQTYLTVWGLRAGPSTEEMHILEVSDLQLPLQLHLLCPHPQRSGDFWEVHCLTVLDLDREKAATLIQDVNGKPHLMKAFLFSDPAEAIQQVRLSLGINLAGGVNLDHVRCQIFEFLERVRAFRREFQ
jgi:hypothetical protein